MNIAFPAVLIFLLVLPALIFNLAFYRTENTPLKDVSLSHKTMVGSAVAISLHSVWLLLIAYVFNHNVNINLLLTLVSGIQGEKFTAAISAITAHELIVTTIYLGTMYVAAYFLGKLCRWLIRKFKLDKKFPLFRIDSPWYYLFTGYDWEDGRPDGVRIAAMVEIANRGYLYVGWLDKFFLDANGNIDRLVLTSAVRREIHHDKSEAASSGISDRFYQIEGHYFVLKYSEIKSLNVQFLKLEELKVQN